MFSNIKQPDAENLLSEEALKSSRAIVLRIQKNDASDLPGIISAIKEIDKRLNFLRNFLDEKSKKGFYLEGGKIRGRLMKSIEALVTCASFIIKNIRENERTYLTDTRLRPYTKYISPNVRL